MKKAIQKSLAVCLSLILFVSMIHGGFITVHAEEGWTQGYVTVNYCGVVQERNVLERNGTLLVPLNWFQSYGINVQIQQTDTTYTLYPLSQKKETRFAKRLFIDRNKHTFTFAVYLGDQVKNYKRKIADNYYPLYSGTFSEWVSYDDVVWVPMTEALALMEIDAHVDEDTGYLCMQPVVITAVDALYKHDAQLKSLMFDADSQIDGSRIMAGSGKILSTFMGHIDNLDFVSNSGRQNYYKGIFESYLLENEDYLKAFDSSSNPIFDYLDKELSQQVSSSLSSVEDFDLCFEEAKEVDDLLHDFYTLYHTGMLFEFIDTMNPYTFQNYLDLADAGTDAWDFVSGIISYGNIYFNQIEDHRYMLSAVYDYRDRMRITGQPSYKAAKAVQELYDTEANHVQTQIKEGVREIVVQGIYGEIKKSVAMPWYVALDLYKISFPDEYKTIEDGAIVDLVDNTVSYSYKIYNERIQNLEFGSKDMDNLRLCAMMSMVGSKYAYNAYWPNSKNVEKSVISNVLYDLYLAALYSDYDNADTFDTLYERYESEMDGLTVHSTRQGISNETLLEESGRTSISTESENDSFSEGDPQQCSLVDLLGMTNAEISSLDWNSCFIMDTALGVTHYMGIPNNTNAQYMFWSEQSGENADIANIVLENDQNYPWRIYLQDQAGSGIQILDNVRTGMSYEEIARIASVSELRSIDDMESMYDIGDVEYSRSYCTIYPEQGILIILYFSGEDGFNLCEANGMVFE